MDLGSHADLSWVQDSDVGSNDRKPRNAALTYVFVPQMRFVFKGYAEIQDGDALSRFGYIEENTLKKGLKFSDLSLEQMDALWNEAKALERR